MSNAVANQDDGWGSVPTTASGVLRGQAGKLHQDGKYYLMKSTAPFNTDQDLVVSGVTTAWQRWERRKPVELRITYPGAAHPDRDGLGHHDEDEWPVGPDGRSASTRGRMSDFCIWSIRSPRRNSRLLLITITVVTRSEF